MRSINTLTVLLYLIMPCIAVAQTEYIDQQMMQRIRNEGLQHSSVMDIAFHITEVTGPRLTGSPGFMKAANYAKNKLMSWGLKNTMLDPWGDFGKSWELKKSYLAMTAPWYKSLEAYPKVWTG